MEVPPQPDEKYNEEIKKGKIMCGRTSYGDEPCPDASKRACKKADPAPKDHPELRYYVKYLPKEEDAVVFRRWMKEGLLSLQEHEEDVEKWDAIIGTAPKPLTASAG